MEVALLKSTISGSFSVDMGFTNSKKIFISPNHLSLCSIFMNTIYFLGFGQTNPKNTLLLNTEHRIIRAMT